MGNFEIQVDFNPGWRYGSDEEIHLAKAKFSFCSLLWILWIVWINILFRILHVSYENYSSRILQEGGMGCGWNLKNLLLMTWTKLLELVPKFQHSFMVQTLASLDVSLYITLIRVSSMKSIQKLEFMVLKSVAVFSLGARHKCSIWIRRFSGRVWFLENSLRICDRFGLSSWTHFYRSTIMLVPIAWWINPISSNKAKISTHDTWKAPSFLYSFVISLSINITIRFESWLNTRI